MRAPPPIRVVFDCNVLLQALARSKGPSGACFELTNGKNVKLFVSRAVVDELRDVSGRGIVQAKLKFTPSQAAYFLDRLLFIAVLVDVHPSPYVHPIDPDDSKYINLALAVGARLVVSRDNDLLNLMDEARREAREFRALFPALRIVSPHDFLVEVRASIAVNPREPPD